MEHANVALRFESIDEVCRASWFLFWINATDPTVNSNRTARMKIILGHPTKNYIRKTPLFSTPVKETMWKLNTVQSFLVTKYFTGSKGRKSYPPNLILLCFHCNLFVMCCFLFNLSTFYNYGHANKAYCCFLRPFKKS